MPNDIGLITKYLTDAFDAVFAAESKTAIFEGSASYVKPDFTKANTVEIASLLLDGLSDYYRVNNGSTGAPYAHYQNGAGDGYKVGNASLKWESFTLRYDRAKQFQIDTADNLETDGAAIAYTLTEFVRTRVIPEVDAIRFSTIASKCSTTLGNKKSETLTAGTVLTNLNTAFKWFKERGVPETEQVIFVSPDVDTFLNNSTEIAKFITQVDLRTPTGITTKVPGLNGRPIIVVPSDRFYTDVVAGDNGYYATDTSKVINYIVASYKGMTAVKRIDNAKIFEPGVVQDFDGYKVNYRIYHDAIIPKNKVPGFYCSISEVDANTVSNVLDVELSLSGENLLLNAFYTTPAGLNGYVVYSTTALNLGDTYASADTNKVIEEGVAFAKVGAEATAYFALVDGNNKIVAVSGAITLPTN